MIKAAPLPNTYFANVAHISLKKDKRDQLRDLKLIKVTEKPLVLELTEAGWAKAIGELGGEVPPRAGSGGGALYAALGFLRELIDHLEVAPADLFRLRVSAAGNAPAPADFEAGIRKAYGEVSSAGEYVSLAKVRIALTADIDPTLTRMGRESDVDLIPNSQQGDLTDDDRLAAVKIGNQDRHLIAIRS